MEAVALSEDLSKIQLTGFLIPVRRNTTWRFEIHVPNPIATSARPYFPSCLAESWIAASVYDARAAQRRATVLLRLRIFIHG
jgi:hypothetical protein